MDIYERLKTDHDHQRSLGDELAQTSGDSEARRTLWIDYKTELETHANAEEQTFYAALIAKPEGQEEARHSIAEHKEANDLIEELEAIDMSSAAWLTKFKHLRHRIEHHVDEEEEDVFPIARTCINDEEAKDLAVAFAERKAAE